jgi:flagellar capping protein FliD
MTIAMQPIYTQTVGAGSPTTVSFLNIPQTFTDLKIDISARSTAASFDNLRLKFNNDSSTIYSQTTLYGEGTTAVSERLASGSNIFILDYASGSIPNASSTANVFSNLTIYVPNYTGSNFKQVISDGATENNAASQFIRLPLGAGLYRSTNSITRIDVSVFGNYAQNSTLTLYGITKG